MKQSHTRTGFSCLLLLSSLLFLGVSCSESHFREVPQTGYIAHYEKNNDSKIPFDSYWNADDQKEWDARINGEHGQKHLICIADIDTSHMDVQPVTDPGKAALQNLAKYFQEKMIAHFETQKKYSPNLYFVPKGTRNAYTLEIAITSITPTNPGVGMVVTALSTVKSGGGILVKRFIKNGHIAMAGRLRDPRGRIVSEFADFEPDHDSILGLDVKNFGKYAHHKDTIDEWAREIAEVYSTAYGTKTRKKMMRISPF
jgi:hypothetical protein